MPTRITYQVFNVSENKPESEGHKTEADATFWLINQFELYDTVNAADTKLNQLYNNLRRAKKGEATEAQAKINDYMPEYNRITCQRNVIDVCDEFIIRKIFTHSW